jgi:hypothetical protein
MSDAFDAACSITAAVLSKLGIDPTTSQLRDEPGTKAWGMKRGSAQVLLSVTRGDRGAWIRIAAPVLRVPPTIDSAAKLKLFSQLLDLNAKSMRNASFGTMGELVVVASERPAEGLDEQEAEQMLRHVSALADHYDDELSTQHGLPHGSRA